MEKGIREILVVKREVLFNEHDFEGFLDVVKRDYIDRILKNYEYRERNDELESNPSFKQIIPYVWIVNPLSKKIFAYQRASGKKNYSERRLMNKWSCGVGGHIDRDSEEGTDNPITRAMMRELMEEVKMNKYPMPKIVGYLNYETDSVGQVHFGVVAIAETIERVEKGDNEMAHGKFYSVDELEEIFNDSRNEIETWTRTSWPFVKDYLEKL